MKFSILLILIYSVLSKDHHISNDKSTIDWNAFEIKNFVKHEDSINFIKSLPLNQYWDASKSSFRTGILADKVHHLYPNLVTAIDKKVTLTAKLHTVATHVVDTSLLFMHSVSAIQSLILSSEKLKRQIAVPNLNEAYPEIYSKLHKIFQSNKLEMNGSNITTLSIFPSLPQLIAKKSFFESKIRSLKNSLSLVHHQQSRRLENIILFNQLKKEQLIQQHVDIIRSIEHHYDQLNQSSVIKFDKLLEIREQTQQSKLNVEIAIIESKYQDDVMILENELNLTLATIAYRTEEEIKISKQQEEFEKVQLLDTKLELLKSEVDLVLDAIFSELLDMGSFFYKDPWLTLSYLKYALGGLICLMLCFEVLQLIIFITKSLFSGNRYIAKKTLNTDTSYNKNNMIFSSDIKVQFHRIIESMQISLSNNLPLPNILLTGPSGCGKSMISQILLNELSPNVPYIVICGGDLKSLGTNASVYLNEIIHKAINKKNRLILVLDEADAIIHARTTTHQVASDITAAIAISTVDGCLFSILNGIRQSSKYISLIITSRLNFSSVDNALLDRIDLTMDMSLPKKSERLEYALHILNETLQPYMTEEERTVLTGLGNIHIILEHILNINIQIPEPISSSSFQVTTIAPELDCPLENENTVDEVFVYIKGNIDTFTNNHFEMKRCLKCMICLSDNWSYRDLKQFLFAVKYAIMCNENCHLNTRIWMNELIYKTTS